MLFLELVHFSFQVKHSEILCNALHTLETLVNRPIYIRLFIKSVASFLVTTFSRGADVMPRVRLFFSKITQMLSMDLNDIFRKSWQMLPLLGCSGFQRAFDLSWIKGQGRQRGFDHKASCYCQLCNLGLLLPIWYMIGTVSVSHRVFKLNNLHHMKTARSRSPSKGFNSHPKQQSDARESAILSPGQQWLAHSWKV